MRFNFLVPYLCGCSTAFLWQKIVLGYIRQYSTNINLKMAIKGPRPGVFFFYYLFIYFLAVHYFGTASMNPFSPHFFPMHYFGVHLWTQFFSMHYFGIHLWTHLKKKFFCPGIILGVHL